MKSLKISCVFLLFLSYGNINAQSPSSHIYEGEYASKNNPYYWKNNPPHAAYWQQDIGYKIRATLDDETEIITGKSELSYTNNSPFALDKVYFRLIQNAFQPETDLHKLNLVNKNKPKFGKYESQKLGTVVENFRIEGYEVETILDHTILIVNLKGKKIEPGQTVKFSMDFKTHYDQGSLRRRMKRFDHSGVKHFDGVHWYPRICVYDAKFGWHTDQHLGKEFYGNFGSFDVELTLPDNYILEATGRLQNRGEVLPDELYNKIKIENYAPKTEGEPYKYVIPRNGSKTWNYYAVNVHDFAFTCDPSYRIGMEMYNGIECIALVQEQNAHGWQPTAKFVAEVVKIYSEDFGMYVYPKMVAADARDGMEYPMITLNGGNWPGHQFVIAHEVGHNWFMGMLGSNETYRAFMDEGFTQFLTTWSLKRINSNMALPNTIDDRSLYNGYMNDAVNWSDATLNTHSDDFETAIGHGGGYRHAYYKTATMLSNLQYVLGDELFLNAMKHYVAKWKIRHPYPEDFRQAIIEYTQVDLNWFFDQWIETTKRIDYAIRHKKRNKKAGTYTLTFVRKGDMQMPIDFTVTTKSGKRINYHIPNTYFVKDSTGVIVLPQWRGWGNLNRVYEAEIVLDEKIKNIEIDTSGRLADVYRIDNVDKGINHFYLNKGKEPALSYNKYYIGIRPDLWWNPIDGMKIGFNWKSDYVKKKHVLDFSVWYNSMLFNDNSMFEGLNRNQVTTRVSYILDYSNLIGKNAYLYYHSRITDGISMDKIGVRKSWGKNTVDVNAKAFGALFNRNMFFHKTEIPGNLDFMSPFENSNNSLNISYTRNYNYFRGSGATTVSLRTPSLFTDYFYYQLKIESINHNKVLGSSIRTRFFAAGIASANGDLSQVPLESQLFLAGANYEEMLDNKFTRTSGYIPNSMFWGATQPGNFQMGGGLNLRGYAGYLAPYTKANGQVEMLYAGMSGISGSVEWDFDDYINFKPKKLRFLKLDAYAFADAGILTTMQLTNPVKQEDAFPFRMDAGIGTALTIRKWGNRNAIKPFTIRFDMPFFLNRPPTGQDYLAFRWLVGIGRSF